MPSSPYSYALHLLSDFDVAFVADGDLLAGDALEDLLHFLATGEQARAELFRSERLFWRAVHLDDAFLRTSARLLFETFPRRSIHDIGHAPHVLERAGSDLVPLFLSENETRIVSEPVVIDYLPDMLASFTTIYRHAADIRIHRSIWRRSRYSDFAAAERPRVYKRAADVSLLIPWACSLTSRRLPCVTTAWAFCGGVAPDLPLRSTRTSLLVSTNSSPSTRRPTLRRLSLCAC